MYVHKYIHMYTYVHTYVRTYTYTVGTYICTHTYICAYTYTVGTLHMQRDSSSTSKSNFYWPCQPTTPPRGCLLHGTTRPFPLLSPPHEWQECSSAHRVVRPDAEIRLDIPGGGWRGGHWTGETCHCGPSSVLKPVSIKEMWMELHLHLSNTQCMHVRIST